MTLYQFLKEFTLTRYPITAAADVFVDENTSRYLEMPVSPELPPYKDWMEFKANVVNRDSQLAGLEVLCVAPFLNREKGKRTELMVYIKTDKENLETIFRRIDDGTLMGRYWNA